MYAKLQVRGNSALIKGGSMRITFHLPEDHYEWLKEQVWVERKNVSKLISELVANYKKQKEEEA